MAVQVLGNGGPDGTVIGLSTTEKIGFYGTSPAAQGAAITGVDTTAATSTTNAYGYSTAAQADAIVTAINAIVAKFTSLGLTA